jgi:hypothetical protein
MAGLVPAIHAVAGIPLVACHGAFFRILRMASRRAASRASQAINWLGRQAFRKVSYWSKPATEISRPASQ